MEEIKVKKDPNKWGEDVFSLLSWFNAEKMENAKVMVVGAGALGNEVLKNLALFGIGNIIVVDFDRIEHSNLCRSVLFRKEDADKSEFKAEVAARRIKEINPNVNIQAISGDIGNEVGLGIFRKMDVIIGCLDSRFARFLINRHCFRANKMWIDGGIENLEGNARIFKPGYNCYECSLTDSELSQLNFRTGCPDIANFNFVQGRVATTPVSASLIGAIQTQEALKIIHGYNEESPEHKCKTLTGRLFKYDGMFLSAKNYKMAYYDDECLSHEIWEPLIKARELSADLKVGAVIEILESLLNTKDITINMMNNKFVYQLMVESTEVEIDVQLPESKVADYIENNNIKENALDRVFQKFYENINRNFPFQDLSLREIGFPHYDIIPVTTPEGLKYVELSKDEDLFF
ncbi:MAG: ThiF family adenylyltransferase [Bacteroidales bacterium]|nr:ThiF family adenylyltransferase [Bacteroidales bacterium]